MKKTSCLGYIRIILHSYLGIPINHYYKDPYYTSRIQWNVREFFRGAFVEVEARSSSRIERGERGDRRTFFGISVWGAAPGK